MNDKKTERPAYLWVMVIVLAVIAVNIVVWFGYVLEITSVGSTDAPAVKLLNTFSELQNYIGIGYLGDAIWAVFAGNGTTRKAFILSIIAAALGLMYFKTGNGK